MFFFYRSHIRHFRRPDDLLNVEIDVLRRNIAILRSIFGILALSHIAW